jgi:serine/threonine protein kinase
MDDTNERISIPSSSDAHAAWAQKYDTKLATLQRGDVEPFTPGRYLGKGGVGAVHETSIGGHVVALKRIWIRGAPKDHHKAEFEILQKMSTKRHHHVVEAIGLYVLPGRPTTELGLLIWPVAQYDLDRLLFHFQILSERQKQPSLESLSVQLTEDESDAFEDLSILTQRPGQGEISNWKADSSGSIDVLLKETSVCLTRVFGCLAQAVQYLHNDQHIRHKDLKPSQVLISATGLWLTDFGWSVDITKLSNSATSNGDQTTAKYHAPEREAMSRCGRSEDIFGLGCIYLELILTLSRTSVQKCLNPSNSEGWSYQCHLDQVELWLASSSTELSDVAFLVRRMLKQSQAQRPTISDVVGSLSVFDKGTKNVHYFGPCCRECNDSDI